MKMNEEKFIKKVIKKTFVCCISLDESKLLFSLPKIIQKNIETLKSVFNIEKK